MMDVGEEALDLLTVDEVAGRLRLSSASVWRLVYSGQIESVKAGPTGRNRRIAPEAVIAYKEKLRSAAHGGGNPEAA